METQLVLRNVKLPLGDKVTLAAVILGHVVGDGFVNLQLSLI